MSKKGTRPWREEEFLQHRFEQIVNTTVHWRRSAAPIWVAPNELFHVNTSHLSSPSPESVRMFSCLYLYSSNPFWFDPQRAPSFRQRPILARVVLVPRLDASSVHVHPPIASRLPTTRFECHNYLFKSECSLSNRPNLRLEIYPC